MSTKKEKAAREMSQTRMKAAREAHLKEAAEYKQRIKPLVHFLRKHHLKFNHASVGNERIEYFRVDDYQKLVQTHRQSIDTNEILKDLIKNASAELIYFKRPKQIKIKYPKVLQPVMPNDPDIKFASFRFDTTQSKKHMTILVIFGVLSLVLFPIWPFWVKYGLWWVSLVLLIILLGIIFIRLAIYLICVIFNYHIWIFPNLFNSTGFFDSFIPVLEIAKGDKSWFSIFLRLFAISSFILLVVHIALNPTFIDQQVEFTKETIQDMHDWGVNKLKNQGNFSQRALTNLDIILNETADVAHLQQHVVEKQMQVVQENEDIQTNAEPDLGASQQKQQNANDVDHSEVDI